LHHSEDVAWAASYGGGLMAGYSGTPLPKKLGIKPGHRVLLVNAPHSFDVELGIDPGAEVELHRRPGKAPYDVAVAFSPDHKTAAHHFATVAPRIETAGALWLAWPKKASGVRTDLDENVVRQTGLAAGLVDVKVCAIDDTWSGLKFVRRLRDR
jgi:hypothetical protein